MLVYVEVFLVLWLCLISVYNVITVKKPQNCVECRNKLEYQIGHCYMMLLFLINMDTFDARVSFLFTKHTFKDFFFNKKIVDLKMEKFLTVNYSNDVIACVCILSDQKSYHYSVYESYAFMDIQDTKENFSLSFPIFHFFN